MITGNLFQDMYNFVIHTTHRWSGRMVNTQNQDFDTRDPDVIRFRQ